MKKKYFLIFVCLFLSKLQAHDLQSQQGKHQQNGRYQISTNSVCNRTQIYLLDTQNGKVWMTTEKCFGYYHPWSQLPILPIEE